MPEIPHESLGTADPSTTIARSHLVEETEYVVTRSVTPTLLGAVDLDAGRVLHHHEFPSGEGAWALDHLDGDLYAGLYPNADLYRFDMATRKLRRVASFPDDSYTTDVAVANGRVYAGTYPTASVYEYDPATDEVREHGEAIEGEDYVRELAADGDDIYVGVGSHAHLVHLDRASGTRAEILPADLREDSWTWIRDLTAEFVVVQTDPSGTVIVLDREDDAEVGRIAPREGMGDCSTVADGTVYFVAENALYGYDVAEDAVETLAPVPDDGLVSVPMVDGDAVYVLGDGSLYRYDLESESLSVAASLPEWAQEVRGVNCSPGHVSASVTDDLWVYDRATGESEVIELRNEGLPPCAEKAQSLAVFDGTPVVAGHGKVHVHGEERHRVHVPGEPKVMEPIGDTLYLGIYGGARIASYTHDRDGLRIEGTIGEEQNRPRSIHHHESSGQLLVGTKADYGKLGGAISTYDPGSGDLDTQRNVIPEQTIHAIASIGDDVYLGSEIYGGLGIDPTAEEAKLAAWDPSTGEVGFDLAPVPGAEVINTLVAVDGALYGGTQSGTLFVVDPDAESVVHTADVASHVGQFAVHDGSIYGVTGDRLIAVDPDSYAVDTLIDDLDPHWFNWPMLSIDESGHAYFLDGYDLAGATL